jgi:hypothetical protein
LSSTSCSTLTSDLRATALDFSCGAAGISRA